MQLKSLTLLGIISSALLFQGCEYQKKEEDTTPDVVVEKAPEQAADKVETVVVETPKVDVEKPTEVNVTTEPQKPQVLVNPDEGATVPETKEEASGDVPEPVSTK